MQQAVPKGDDRRTDSDYISLERLMEMLGGGMSAHALCERVGATVGFPLMASPVKTIPLIATGAYTRTALLALGDCLAPGNRTCSSAPALRLPATASWDMIPGCRRTGRAGTAGMAAYRD
jgi:hypothetical protein